MVQKSVTKEASALSLQQKKLLYFLISNINADDTDFKQVTISIADYLKLIGVDEGGADRKNLKKEIQSFADKSFWIPEGQKKEVLYRWIDTAEINYETNVITLELHKTVKKFLLGLDKKSRAIFQLGYAMTFKHKYSPDLYAFAASIKDFMTKEKTMYKMPIEDATMKFGCNKYQNSFDWKRRILDPSIKEINEKTDLNLKVDFLKTDKLHPRKITYVLFGVTRKTGEELARVKINALNENMKNQVNKDASAYAKDYGSEYAVEKLGVELLELEDFFEDIADD